MDYTIDGFTGWINQNSDAEGLVNIMTNIINNPSQISYLNKKIVNNRSSILKTMDQHFYEIDEIYRKLAGQ